MSNNEKKYRLNDFSCLFYIMRLVFNISIILLFTSCNKPSCYSHYLSVGKSLKEDGKYAEAIGNFQAACACPDAKVFETDILIVEAQNQLDKSGRKKILPVDTDSDGFPDVVDECDSLAGVNNGCPLVMREKLDSFLDNSGHRCSYTGPTYFHLPDGYGVAEYLSTTIYTGNYKEGKRNGQGRFVYGNNEIYTGGFKNDKWEGFGVWQKSNGDKYEGTFVGGKCDGKGVYTCDNGDHYNGNYKDGFLEGKGILIRVSGTNYDGYFKKGKYEGNGVLQLADGSKYEGDFVNGTFEGAGTYMACDTCIIFNCAGTSVFIGHWKADRKEGYGKCYKKAGGKLILIHEGDFVEGKPVGKYPNKI